jgi:hypothetical protein
MREQKGETHILGFRCSGFHSFHIQTSTDTNLQKGERGMVGPAFQYFRVRNFASSGVQHQHEQAFEKEKMPSTSRFRGSESHDLKNQHQTQTNPEIAKRKEHRTNILGFRGFGIP